MSNRFVNEGVVTYMKEITLEMSLKPFKENNPEAIKEVCLDFLDQWKEITAKADVICVLLWIGDGSEILEYAGDFTQEIEWGRYIGRANEFHGDWNPNTDPQKVSPHTRNYLYMNNPPAFTYQDLEIIVNTIKEVGEDVLHKPIKVGATFDPGPEFAVSKFKYKWHPEICTAGTMGIKVL